MFKNPLPLLIADDEQEYTTFIVDFLRLEGYAPTAAYSLSDVLRKLQENEFELLVLTADLSAQPVSQLCLDIAQQTRAQVVIQDISGKGALKAPNIRVVPKLRSAKALHDLIEEVFADHNPDNEKRPPISAGALHINAEEGIVTLNGENLELTATEFSLLELLALNANNPVKKDDIYQKVLGRARQPFDRSVDVHISSIRHKLNAVAKGLVCIRSIRGVGYTLLLP